MSQRYPWAASDGATKSISIVASASKDVSHAYKKHGQSIEEERYNISFVFRAVYDYSTIHNIVNAASIIHVSFIPSTDDPFPTTLPMLGHMGSFASPNADSTTKPLDLYIHGYISSRLMRLPEGPPPSTDGQDTGLPVCVSAAHLDGIVLALTPFHNSMNYRSAVLHGYAQPVTDSDEKLWAMQLITEGIIPGGWDSARVPPTKAELQSTQILRVQIKSASAKVRTGGPSEDRKDLKDEELRKRVWTGVVPVWENWGEPMKAEENEKEGGLPEYIRQVGEHGNEARRAYAERAVREA